MLFALVRQVHSLSLTFRYFCTSSTAFALLRAKMAAYASSNAATAHAKRAAVDKPAQSSAQLGKRLQQELMNLMVSVLCPLSCM